MELTSFALLVLHRALSGIKNHVAYRKNYNLMYLVAAYLSVFPFIAVSISSVTSSSAYLAVSYVLSLVSSVSTLLVANSFKPVVKVPRDVHLYESLTTSSFVIGMFSAGVDIIYIFLSVPVSMVLHKGFINLAVNRPFIDKKEITDDPTGKTYGIPLLGIKVPRLNRGYLRVAMAAACIIYIVVNELFIHYYVSIFDLMK